MAPATGYWSRHCLEAAPLSRARESRLGCRSGAQRDQSAWGGGEGRSLADRWIISSLNRLIADTTALIEDYQFGEAGRQIYDFFWSQYCDWYLETAKIQLRRAASCRPSSWRPLTCHSWTSSAR